MKILIKRYEELKEIYRRFSDLFGVDLPLLLGITTQESALNTKAVRFEPAFLLRYVKKSRNCDVRDVSTREILLSCSFGLGQVMGQVAFENGLQKDKIVSLLDPDINLHYTCKILAKLLKKYADRDKAIASYNAGSPRYNSNNQFVNQRYVDKVKRFSNEWKNYFNQINRNLLILKP